MKSINKWEQNVKWSITQFTVGAILFGDFPDMTGDVYEQIITLDEVSEHRNLVGLVDVWEHSNLGCPTSEGCFSANLCRMNEISGSYTHYKPQVMIKQLGGMIKPPSQTQASLKSMCEEYN